MQKYIQTTKRMWEIYTPYHKYIYFQLVITIILQLLSIVGTSILSKVIGILPEKNIDLLVYLLAGWFVVSVIQSFANYLSSYNSTFNLSGPSQQYLQEYSLSKILGLTIEQHMLDHSAIKREIITRGESSVANFRDTLFQDILPAISFLIISLATLTYTNPYLGAFSMIASLIIFIWSKKFLEEYVPLYEVDRRNWIEQSKVRTEAFSHLPLVKYLAGEKKFVQDYIDVRQKILEYFYKVTGMQIRHRAKKWAFTDLSEFVGACLAVYLFIQGDIALGVIYLVFTLNSKVFGRITQLQGSMRNLPMMMVDIEKYFEAVDKKPSYEESGSKPELSGDITVQNVHLTIDQNKILAGLNTTIPKGSKTALVGTSGSGKSTFVKVLLRAYNYSIGSITIGGAELAGIDAQHIRRRVGYVEQQVDLFDDTIKNNILFGLSGEEQNKAEQNLEDVCKKARITEFYHRLEKDGLDTLVGERGIKLSGGERQRVGIARALIRNPDILIFDEATSALDTENESYIKEAIDEASVGRTTIIIAHRLSTVIDADKIIVMDKGAVVAEGTHEELMLSSQHYKTLVEHQLTE